jgi:copper(I)-binding protein
MRNLSLFKLLFALALLFSSLVAQAHGSSKGDLLIEHPYATPSLAGSPHGAAYLRGVRNKGQQADRLIRASSPVAERVELHRMEMDSGVMRMREVSAIELPAGSTTSLRHGGEYHLMLMNLKRPLKDGDRFDLTLTFERAGTQSVKVWVQTPKDASGDAQHKH